MPTSGVWRRLLPRMRWFAGKSRTIADVAVRPLPWATPVGAWPAVREELAEVTYTDGGAETYHLVSAYRPEGVPGLSLAVVDLPELGQVSLSDATTDPDAFAAYLAGVPLDPVVEVWTRPQPLGVEQSNSSVRIADNALFKVLRRPQPGGEREVALLERLADTGVTPRVFGTTWTEPHALSGVVMEFISSVGDGWQLATAACREGRDFRDPAAALGRALRTVHRRLAQATGDDPGATSVPGDRLAAAMAERLQQAAAELPAIAALADELTAAFAAVADHAVVVHQIHGDFHLGQALYRGAEAGWVLIDFEGEPLVPVAERNRPDSGWRDVAGALRSFDYVRGAQTHPESPAVRAWTAQASAAFLDGYADGEPVPHDLLRAYVLDKAVYEVRYEAANRPEWVHIPLQTVQDELTGLGRENE
ncbi:MAG: phosphotransferase [Propionibacteriales bacterium]|nr:phosphotransferase [Propionibacteriales bacterium]